MSDPKALPHDKQEDHLRGTSKCPICGQDTPHGHPNGDQELWIVRVLRPWIETVLRPAFEATMRGEQSGYFRDFAPFHRIRYCLMDIDAFALWDASPGEHGSWPEGKRYVDPQLQMMWAMFKLTLERSRLWPQPLKYPATFGEPPATEKETYIIDEHDVVRYTLPKEGRDG